MFLLGHASRDATPLLEQAVYPRMPCSVPGQLQELAGRAQGQQVRGRWQDAAVWADSMMTRCLEWDVVPGRKVK